RDRGQQAVEQRRPAIAEQQRNEGGERQEHRQVAQIDGERPAAQGAERAAIQQARDQPALEGEDEQRQGGQRDGVKLAVGIGAVEDQRQQRQHRDLQESEGARTEREQAQLMVQRAGQGAQAETADAQEQAAAQAVDAAKQTPEGQDRQQQAGAFAATGQGQQRQTEQQTEVEADAQAVGGRVHRQALGVRQPGLEQQQVGEQIRPGVGQGEIQQQDQAEQAQVQRQDAKAARRHEAPERGGAGRAPAVGVEQHESAEHKEEQHERLGKAKQLRATARQPGGVEDDDGQGRQAAKAVQDGEMVGARHR